LFTKKLNFYPYLLVLPGLLLFSIFCVYPIVQNIYFSFFKWRGFTEKVFCGFDNYLKVFRDDLFLQALRNTGVLLIAAVSVITLLAFALAVLIDLKFPGWQFFKVAFFITYPMSTAIVGMLFLRVYEENIGLINTTLSFLHLDFLQRGWLANPKITLFSIVGIIIWRWTGFIMIFFLNAIKTIPRDIYEAARIDGANFFQVTIRITIPMLKNIIAVIITLLFIICLRSFDIIWFTTQGGPINSTHILSTLIYVSAFSYGKVGRASVISIVMFLIAVILSINYYYFSAYREEI